MVVSSITSGALLAMDFHGEGRPRSLQCNGRGWITRDVRSMRVISYSDQMAFAAGADERFGPNSYELTNRLQVVQANRGDTVHTSGHADYVVRTLVNYPDPEEHLPPDTTCFAIAAGADRVQVLVKHGTAHGDVIAEVEYDDDNAWIGEIVQLFELFRDSLEN